MIQQFFSVLGQYGLAVVAINVLLNQIGLPVPVVPTLMVAGAIAANGQLPLGWLFLAAVGACVAADCIWYGIGQKYGIRVLKVLCRISLEPDSCVSETQSQFDRWGINSLVVAKFVPGWATIAPPLAGAMRIGWLRFIALSLLAAMLWAGAGLLAGVLFNTQIERLLIRLDQVGSIALAAGASLLAAYVGYKWWERRRFYQMLRMARISTDELHELMQSGAAPIIIDVRSPTARELEPRWIPGALHISLPDVGVHLKDLPRDRDIILYCTCPSEASAARVAKILMNHGFRRVRPLHGGLDAWVAAGHTVARPDEHQAAPNAERP
ncbi:MAG TPA: DedA family protein/thiosulfate sulfurtransferase GlpE [Steroidobacteraceae bacterium]|nr:DedA family protein/thiosulfate sulfurtransferase GlpE [Steroidobacteraceae bacterium]